MQNAYNYTNYLLAHSDNHIVNKCYKNHAGIEASCTPLALIEYLCYLHLGLGSASGNNKDILLMVGFNN